MGHEPQAAHALLAPLASALRVSAADTPAVRSARAQELRKQQKFLLKLHHMQQMALLERQRLELVEMSERMAAFPKPTGADLATPGIPPVQKEQKDRKSKAQDPWSWEDGVVTTVMIRGIPRHWTQQTLLKTVADEGFEEQVDFLYVPSDGKQREAKANVGYGFVNFHDAELALKFRNSFDGRVLHHHTPRNKAVRVHPASIQGYDANVAYFMDKKTADHPSFSPLIFPVAGNKRRGSQAAKGHSC